MNKQTISNLTDYCSEVKHEIIPGITFAWSRQGEKRTFNVVIKGVDWHIPNSLIRAYLSCFGDVTKDSVRWADMKDSSWLAGNNPDTGAEAKLASGERLARLTTTKTQLPRDHIINGKRFFIEHRGQRSCRNCLGGPNECEFGCDDKLCQANKDQKRYWRDIIKKRSEKEFRMERIHRLLAPALFLSLFGSFGVSTDFVSKLSPNCEEYYNTGEVAE